MAQLVTLRREPLDRTNFAKLEAVGPSTCYVGEAYSEKFVCSDLTQANPR